MNKVKVKFLDIPIIRSCNLGCGGCLTFSDSKKIKGTVNLNESKDWLEHWAARLDPEAVTVFGGEPLLHPQFVDWCRELRRLWPEADLRINTNGYYLDRLYSKVDQLFTEEIKPQFIVSIQTGHEPYYSIVKNNIETLKDKVLVYYKQKYPNSKVVWNLWLDEEEIYKKWWRIDIDDVDTRIRVTSCEQWRIYWQAHYQGKEDTLLPFYNYDDPWYKENHEYCQAKEFVNLYKGKIYKCPTTAVLEHTLTTFNLENQESWKPYLTNYVSLDMTASDEEVATWFKTQAEPEKICNMCGFGGPQWSSGHINRHELKENWKFEVIPIESL
jgi:organic radical activating enzyme